jgi:FdhD protein
VPTEAENAVREAPLSVASDRSTVKTVLRRLQGTDSGPITDILAIEEPLELQLGFGAVDQRQMKSISVTMRTPGNDFELAVGFLMTEGVIKDAADIAEIVYVSGRTENSSASQDRSESAILPYQPERNIVRLELQPDVTVSLANLERNFYTTSSCGICGKASLLALRTVCPAPECQ